MLILPFWSIFQSGDRMIHISRMDNMLYFNMLVYFTY